MKRVLALYFLVCAAYAQNEPEPEGYSTSMEPEPEEMSTMMTTSGMETSGTMTSTGMTTSGMETSGTMTSTGMPMNSTTTAQEPMHTITLSATLPNLASFANATALISDLTSKIKESTEPGANVVVTIKALRLKVTYDGFTAPIDQVQADNIIDAVLAMYSDSSLTRSDISVNGMNHSLAASGRRLQTTYTADTLTTVPNDGATDVVGKTKELQAKNTAAALKTKLGAINSSYSAMSFDMQPPEVQLEVLTTVKGQVSAPSGNTIATSVGALLNATVTVDVVTTNSPEAFSTGGQDEDHAPIAPVMTVWAALYAFVML